MTMSLCLQANPSVEKPWPPEPMTSCERKKKNEEWERREDTSWQHEGRRKAWGEAPSQLRGSPNGLTPDLYAYDPDPWGRPDWEREREAEINLLIVWAHCVWKSEYAWWLISNNVEGRRVSNEGRQRRRRRRKMKEKNSVCVRKEEAGNGGIWSDLTGNRRDSLAAPWGRREGEGRREKGEKPMATGMPVAAWKTIPKQRKHENKEKKSIDGDEKTCSQHCLHPKLSGEGGREGGRGE